MNDGQTTYITQKMKKRSFLKTKDKKQKPKHLKSFNTIKFLLSKQIYWRFYWNDKKNNISSFHKTKIQGFLSNMLSVRQLEYLR